MAAISNECNHYRLPTALESRPWYEIPTSDGYFSRTGRSHPAGAACAQPCREDSGSDLACL